MNSYTSNPPGGNHWNSHALRWHLIGPPLRPSPDDLAVIAGVVSELGAGAGAGARGIHTLVLGVTPEYARFPWPTGTSLVALERCESMIRHVWPAQEAGSHGGHVIQGDWLRPPESIGQFDLVLGDGVLSQLSYPEDYERFCQAARGLTRPGGLWALRLYTRQTTPEDLYTLMDDVREGRLTNINEFKLRLGMALCDANHADDVAVTEMWRAWDRSGGRDPALHDRWPAELRSTIDNYREGTARYSFPHLEPVLDILRRFAAVKEVSFPGYPFGRCCPTVVLEP
jgi:hypothetical protein